MTFTPNKWNEIRAFYRDFTPLIMAAPKNEWAADAYEWCSKDMIFMTPIESWFWHDIRACDAVLYPQYPVLDFFVDFANPKAKMAIECDGAAYHADKEKDAARGKRLADIGWSIYRISGAHCRKDSDEETGAPSIAHLFMQRICDIHGISRNTRSHADPQDMGDGFVPMADSIARWWSQATEIRNERRRNRGEI